MHDINRSENCQHQHVVAEEEGKVVGVIAVKGRRVLRFESFVTFNCLQFVVGV